MAKSILVVDDDDSLRDSLILILEESQFNVDSARTGRAALKVLQHKKYDAIILDDNLPYIQGSDLLGLIRAQDRNVKIIMVSGLFDKETREKIMGLGADVVIEKPFNFEDIIEHIS